MSIREKLLDFLFPPKCCICGEILSSGKVFCDSCAEEIMENKSAKFVSKHDFAFSKAVFAADYSEKTQRAVLRMKKFADANEVEEFAKLLAFTIIKELSDAHFDLVTAVPMSEEKLKERGHNQAEALAVRVAQRLSLPYRGDLLIQGENFSAQHTLTRSERESAAKERFSAAQGVSITGRVLLVDDVITTGATLNRCAELLRSIGASDVVAAAALSTPKKKNTFEGNN